MSLAASRFLWFGLALGGIAALAITRVFSGLLYGIEPTDSVTFVSIMLLLFAVALAAAFFPARRAARLNPIEALRFE